MEELAGPEVVAPACSEAGHHEEVPGAAGQLVSAVRYEEGLEAVGRFSAEVAQRPHSVGALGRRESEVGLGVRTGLVHLGQHKGWARLDAALAC